MIALVVAGAWAEARAQDHKPLPLTLTPLEEGVIRETNLLRGNPAAYARYLEEMLPRFRGMSIDNGRGAIRTREGAAAVEEAIRVLRSTPAMSQLRPSVGLSSAARDHVRAQGPTGQTGHSSAAGAEPSDRVERHGRPIGIVLENISYGAIGARAVVIELLVDDGNRHRGHRATLLHTGLGVIGVACGVHQSVYKGFCVVDYARDFREAWERPSESPGGWGDLLANTPRPTMLNGAPSQMDNDFIVQLNLMRTQPASYASVIESIATFFDELNVLRRPGRVGVQMNRGAVAYRALAAALRTSAPKPPLVASPGMMAGARDMTRALGPDGIGEAARKFSSTTAARRYGEGDMHGETQLFGDGDATDFLLQMATLDYRNGRVAAVSLMETTSTHVGFACGPHEKYQHVCVFTSGRNYAEYDAKGLAFDAEVLAEINGLRADPRAYAAKLLRSQPADTSVSKIASQLATAKPVGALRSSTGLWRRGRALVKSFGPVGRTEIGTQSYTVRRPSSYGKPAGAVDERTDYGEGGAAEVVARLLAQSASGEPSLLIDAKYSAAAVACGAHKSKVRMCVVNVGEGFEESTP